MMDCGIECCEHSALFFLYLQSLLYRDICEIQDLAFFVIESHIHALNVNCLVPFLELLTLALWQDHYVHFNFILLFSILFEHNFL